MAKQNREPERRVFVKISSGDEGGVRFETWRYWEIVGELISRHLDRLDAYEAARWCARFAKPGDTTKLMNGVTLEVTENG